MDSRDNGRINVGKEYCTTGGKTMEYKVISGDGHIDLRWLPHDLFVSHAPRRGKTRCPTCATPRPANTGSPRGET